MTTPSDNREEIENLVIALRKKPSESFYNRYAITDITELILARERKAKVETAKEIKTETLENVDWVNQIMVNKFKNIVDKIITDNQEVK